jgi:hypothetical protein
LLHALILRSLKRNDEADGTFRSVLRLSPNHALDPMLYPPTLIRRFDAIKKEMAQAQRLALTVVTQPSGATVFIDGVAVGKSPHTQSLLPGAYVVTVGKDKASSLPHRVELKEPSTLRVDLAFEQRVDLQRLLCISDDGATKGRLDAALKLAAPLDVDTLYLVRLEPPGNAPGWFAASVIDVKSAQKTREGGLKLQAPSRPPEGITELANFILTGEAKGKVHPGPLSGSNGPPSASPAPRAALPTAGEAQATRRSERSWKTPAGWAAGGVGLLAAGAGVVFGLQSSSAWSDFNAHYQDGRAPDVSRADALKALQDRAESKKGLATASFITAGVGLVAGTYLLWSDISLPFLKRSEARAEISAGPSSLWVTIR